MLESGLVKRWIMVHWPKQDVCESKTKVQASPATLGHTMGGFLALMTGLTVSFLVFCAEVVFLKCTTWYMDVKYLLQSSYGGLLRV